MTGELFEAAEERVDEWLLVGTHCLHPGRSVDVCDRRERTTERSADRCCEQHVWRLLAEIEIPELILRRHDGRERPELFAVFHAAIQVIAHALRPRIRKDAAVAQRPRAGLRSPPKDADDPPCGERLCEMAHECRVLKFLIMQSEVSQCAQNLSMTVGEAEIGRPNTACGRTKRRAVGVVSRPDCLSVVAGRWEDMYALEGRPFEYGVIQKTIQEKPAAEAEVRVLSARVYRIQKIDDDLLDDGLRGCRNIRTLVAVEPMRWDVPGDDDCIEFVDDVTNREREVESGGGEASRKE